MNTNTIRDNVGGTTALDLSAGGGVAKFPNGLNGVITSIGGGHTLADWNFGFSAAATSGTMITHGIKNASGAASTPVVVVSPSIQTAVLVNAVGTTTFNVQPASNCNVFWLALLA